MDFRVVFVWHDLFDRHFCVPSHCPLLLCRSVGRSAHRNVCADRERRPSEAAFPTPPRCLHCNDDSLNLLIFAVSGAIDDPDKSGWSENKSSCPNAVIDPPTINSCYSLSLSDTLCNINRVLEVVSFANHNQQLVLSPLHSADILSISHCQLTCLVIWTVCDDPWHSSVIVTTDCSVLREVVSIVSNIPSIADRSIADRPTCVLCSR